MKPFEIVFLVLFIIVSLLHLTFCFLKIEKFRKITKCFCMFFLLGLLISRYPNFNFVWIGLSFGIVGDFFLLWPKNKTLFTVGAISFFIGHVFYAIQMCLIANINDVVSILLIVLSFIFCYAIILIVLYLKLHPKMKELTLPGLAYMAALFTMLIISIIITCKTEYKAEGALMIVGYLLFILSDALLFVSKFFKDFNRKDFYIMSTYIAAQFLITFSIVNILLLK